jgi:hypothetical protein
MALSQKDKKGVVLIAVAGAVMIGLFGAHVAVGNKPKPALDGCTGTPTANTVIVLDHSETISEQTRHEITARALAHVELKSAPNERVTVFDIGQASKKALTPVFSRCKPAQDGSRLTENVAAIKKTYQRDFIGPLKAVLDVPPANDKESPIAQSVIDISLSQYLRGEHNSLLVFSDLLEHTPKFSVYTCSDPERVISAFRESRKGAQERPVFKNTTVTLNVIPRTDVPKGALRCRDKLWPWFFGDSEGKGAGADIDNLPGA